MSIMGRHIPTDALYPGTALVVLQDVKKWLTGETKDGHSVLQFCKILEQMAAEEPFDPANEMVRDTCEPLILPPIVDGFQYRRPVWELIAEETARFGVTTSSPMKSKAQWLMQQLKLCKQYVEYENALTHFRAAVLGLGLSFYEDYEGFLDDVDVAVQGGFKAKGKRAREDIRKIVDSLISALTKHIQKDKKA